jgi:hypothetical protein
MGVIRGQSFEIYDYVQVASTIPRIGEQVPVKNIPYFGGYAVFMAVGDGNTAIDELVKRTTNIAVLPLATWGSYRPAKGQTVGVTITINGASFVQMIIGDGIHSILEIINAIPFTPEDMYELVQSEIAERQRADTVLQGNIDDETAERQQADTVLDIFIKNVKDYFQEKFEYLLERLAQWIPNDIGNETGLLILTENNKVLIEESRKKWRMEE